MSVDKQQVKYFIFDVEAIGDGDLISRVRYPDEDLEPHQALQRYREDLIAQTGRDVLPPTFVLPISVVVAKVDREFRLLDVTALDAPDYRPEQIARKFWDGWSYYDRPTLVTFNGRGYDLPVLEFAAFRYGLSLPAWFNVESRSFEQARNRYNIDRHMDLMDLFSNFGATRISGGLNLLANLIGKPGKIGVDGSQVQGMYDDGKVEEINDYCRCDVLDTYFVFLRSRVLLGKITREEERSLISDAHDWLSEKAETCSIYETYLANWGDRQSLEPGTLC